MIRQKQDLEKERRWQKTIREAAQSDLSIREFCRRRKLNVSQFYWWRLRLKTRQSRIMGKPGGDGRASFALVSGESGTTDAGIELLLGEGRRLRISRGVNEETLRAVLAALEGC